VGNIDERSESKRAQILNFIVEHPGAHLRKIRRELNLAMGVVQYHLYALEKERKVVSRRGGFYKRYYPTLVFGDRELEIMDVLVQETERDLVLFLMQNPNATQKELSGYARVSPSSINWHMQRLSKSGLIGTTHEGGNVKYFVKANRAEILALLKNYHPAVWERWADRLADILLE
jgi:predicted transcriptional regulator